MSIVSRRKTTFFFFLFLLSFFFTKFDARRIKLVQFRIGGVGNEKERRDSYAGQERRARRERA